MSPLSNPFAEYYLAKHVLDRLSTDLGYTNGLEVSSIDDLKGLKEQLLTGPVEMQVLNERWLQAKMPLRQYHEAICKRHFYGVRRVRRLGRCGSRLLGVKWSSAWTLTTVYYSAYFAALELLESSGRHVSHFSSQQAGDITTRATVSANRASLKSGTYLGIASVNVAADEVTIDYRQNTAKPHEFAWKELDDLVRNVTMTDPKGIRHQTVLRRFLGAKQDWSKPNDVRNLWNYSDPALFSEEGERVADAFIRHVTDPKDLPTWASDSQLPRAIEHEATGIAYLQASLIRTVDEVAKAVLPESLAIQCAV